MLPKQNKRIRNVNTGARRGTNIFMKRECVCLRTKRKQLERIEDAWEGQCNHFNLISGMGFCARTHTHMFNNIYPHAVQCTMCSISLISWTSLFSLEALCSMFAHLWCNCRVSLRARGNKIIPHGALGLHFHNVSSLSKHLWRWTNTLTPCQSVAASHYGYSFMWTMLCPLGSLWMSKQRVLPSVPWAVCVVLWPDSPVGYIMSLYWMFFPLLHIPYFIYL